MVACWTEECVVAAYIVCVLVLKYTTRFVIVDHNWLPYDHVVSDVVHVRVYCVLKVQGLTTL